MLDPAYINSDNLPISLTDNIIIIKCHAIENMKDSIYLSTTYLKLLLSDSDLNIDLANVLGSNSAALLNEEYIYGDTIFEVFQSLEDSGLDSWLLRFGKQLSVASHGPLGFAILTAPDLHSAIDVVEEYNIIRTSAYRCKSVHEDNRVWLVSEDNTEHPLIGRWMMETSIRVGQEFVEAVMAHPLGDAATISFTHDKPSYHEELEAFYGIKVSYNADRTALSIPSSWCRIASPLSDPETFQTNLQKCRELKLKLNAHSNIVESTRLSIEYFLESRIKGNHDTQLPSLEQLAMKHHCSSRTFARKLGQHQQSYKKILEDCRRRYAVTLLTQTHASIADVSYSLGYQEAANFVRAFKTWFDMPPASWRRQQTPKQ